MRSDSSHIKVPEALGILAGRGVYPRLVAEGARAAGVKRIVVYAFRGQAGAPFRDLADQLHWLNIGQYGKNLELIPANGPRHLVLAGQISPVSLFRARFDKAAIQRLASLSHRNADTIYGAVIEDLAERGMDILPASAFMGGHIPAPGNLTAREPTPSEQKDIDLGLTVAAETSRLNIGQTVVIKHGTVIAVEAFEGTNATIRRAGRLGRKGCVMIKVASQQHDMRFDIPGIGLKTISQLKRAGFTAVAMQAHRTLLFDMPRVVAAADAAGIAMTAVDSGLPHAPVAGSLQ